LPEDLSLRFDDAARGAAGGGTGARDVPERVPWQQGQTARQMAAVLRERPDLLGEGSARGGAGAVSGGTTSNMPLPAHIFPPCIPIKEGEVLFVEYFAGTEDPFDRFERLSALTPFLKANAEGKIVVEQEKLRNKRVGSLQSYLIFQERLAAWALATGRWTALEVEQHRGYVHGKIVPFEAVYTWAAVVEFDHNFRVSQHLRQLEWGDSATALVQAKIMPHSKEVASALSDMRAATKRMGKGGGGHGQAPPSTRTAGARVEMKNMKTAGGKDICIAFQVGRCTGGCGREHVCHVCRKAAATCACTSHKRGAAEGASSSGSAAALTSLAGVSAPTAVSAAANP